MSGLAMLFPGQGAQHVGMGVAFAEASPEARARFDEASATLGYDLLALCREGPVEELTRSDRAQPAIFVASILAWEFLAARVPGLAPAAMAGLSSGEWAALCAAGAVSYADALRVLKVRGEAMEEACRASAGAMLGVLGLTPEQLDPICEETGVQLANFNSPVQIVLSGPAAGIEAAEKKVTEAGARRAIRLNVSGAFHSRLMAPAAERLGAFLADLPLRAPRIPVVANVDAAPHGDPASIRDRMTAQITGSVRWVDTVRRLTGQGVRTFVECGPGKVLAGLVKRIDSDAVVHTISDIATGEVVAAALTDAPAA